MAEEALTPRLKWLATRIMAIFAVWVTLAHLDVVQAAESNVFENPAVAAGLISAEDGITPDRSTVSLGLILEYGEGWKGHWRTPGEVGLAPEVDCQGSSNLASSDRIAAKVLY